LSKHNLLSFFLKLFFYNIKKWVFAFLVLVGLSIYSVREIYKLSWETSYTFNLFDVLFYEFGLFMYIFLIIIPIYIFLISDIFIDKRIDTYIYSRIYKKTSIWKNKIFLIFVVTVLYMVSAVFINIIIGGLSLGFPNDWSEAAVEINSVFSQEEFRYVNTDFLNFSPLLATLVLISLLTLGLAFLGIIINLTTIIFKKPIISFALGMSINFILLICFKYNDYIDIQILPHQHFLLIFKDVSLNIMNFNSITFSYFYWLLTIAVATYISFFFFKKSNYIFEVKEYD
jgi:hypothetical protein